MCGIIGYIGGDNAVPILIEGLKRLEYRGYDSAGIAVIHDAQLAIRKAVGKLKNLEDVVEMIRLPVRSASAIRAGRPMAASPS